MNNPLKSQIAANRERFEEKVFGPFGKDNLDLYLVPNISHENQCWVITRKTEEVRSQLESSQTSLLQTAIAAVEGLKGSKNYIELLPFGVHVGCTSGPQTWDAALSKVVELLKGGIEII